MMTRHLHALLAPRSVAVFGASDRPQRDGTAIWNRLAAEFKGTLYAVNPRLRQLGEHKVWHSVAELPQAPDLAVICTPAATVPSLIAALGARGCKAAVVVSAGLSEDQTQTMLAAARPYALRILGPDCTGLLVPHLGLNTSLAQVSAQPGSVAFVSQSAALVTAMMDWASSRQIGFSHFISLGEHADVDFADVLDYLASDARTRAIMLYVETLDEPRKFLSAARVAARNKPLIVVKGGRSGQGQLAASTHSAALAGSDRVFDAAVSRAGMLRVFRLQHLFMAAELLARFRDNRSEELIVLTNGGGAGVLAADAADYARVRLARLSAERIAELDAVLPAGWSRANPVDIGGDAPPQRYLDALRILLRERDCAVLLLHAPTGHVPSLEIAQALLPLASEKPVRVLGCWLGTQAVAAASALFRSAGIPDYDTPEDAVRAFASLRQHRHHQIDLMETPPAAPLRSRIDLPGIRELVEFVLADGREWLTEPEAKELLKRAGLPVTPTRVVPPEAQAAVYAAETLGYPVVLKILSHDITHKSDVGGVRLDLHNAAEVEQAARSMLERVAHLQPQARIEGFTVQPMARRAHAHELIIGSRVDPLFGPVILFGQGGVAVEVLADRAVALPPLNGKLARSLVERTRVAKLLQGYRNVPAAHQEALVDALVAVSQLLAEVPEIAELDINPLLLNPEGALVLDARLRLSSLRPGGAAQFAIRPYPLELIETLPFADGRTLTLRPIRPEDEALLDTFFAQLDPEDIRLRLFYSRRSFEHSELARMTQIDYEREMAFIATLPLPDGSEEMIGDVRGLGDPDNIEAEFGVLVRSDMKGHRLGWILMDKLIRYLRANGTQRIVGAVLRENSGMLALGRKLGFSIVVHPEDSDLRHLDLPLQGPQSGH